MFDVFSANCLGQENNCLYPNRMRVTDAASLAAAVSRDYVCAEYKGSYRSNVNFITSNCMAVDFDNDHSEDPALWVKPEDVRTAFPDVTMGFHYSRHHLKPKHGKPPRPKFHVMLEIDPVADADTYSRMKRQIAAFFPQVDPKALDAARFFYGQTTVSGVSWTTVALSGFTNTPTIVVSYAGNPSSSGIAVLKTGNESASSFQVCMAGSSGSGSRKVNWIAIGT